MKPIRYIPFLHTHPEIKQEMVLEFERFYDDQDYILGKGLKKFENEYAGFNDTKYAIGVGNGHDALLIILKCLGIGEGDEVIIPAHTFVATALSVVNSGALPILADIDEHTFNIHPQEIERKITSKTKAIIPVHLYGNPADMLSIMAIADKYQLPVIEDNAQAQGADINGKKTGSLGLMSFTSFYPTKNIGALGDGGVITTNSTELAEKAKVLRNYGKTKDGEYSSIGINSRLDELQARLLSVKLKYLSKWNSERMEIARWYNEQLQGIKDIKLQSSYVDARNVRHIFPILNNNRDRLKDYLRSLGIEAIIHYQKPIHLHPAFSFLGHKTGDFPVAEKVCREELSLPIYPGLRREDVIYVCETIEEFCG